jgi:tetratricopeptide (TPR) repeat protein
MIAWPAAGEDFKQVYACARQKMQSGDYPAAGIELNKALSAAQFSSEEAEALFDLSYVCLKMSNHDESLKYLEQIMDIPDLAGNDRSKAYFQMADVHAAAQKYDDAIDDCDQGISKATAVVDKYRLLMKAANIMNIKKDYTAALDYARQALALCQDNAQNRLAAKKLMAWTYNAQENYPGVAGVYARQELNALPPDVKKSVYPTIVNAYMKVAGSMRTDKDYGKAMEIYCWIERDKSVKPEQRAEAYMGEANIFKAQKKYSEAIKSYNVVLSIQEAKPDHSKIARKEIEQLQSLLAKQTPADNDKKDNTSAGAGRP